MYLLGFYCTRKKEFSLTNNYISLYWVFFKPIYTKRTLDVTAALLNYTLPRLRYSPIHLVTKSSLNRIGIIALCFVTTFLAYSTHQLMTASSIESHCVIMTSLLLPKRRHCKRQMMSRRLVRVPRITMNIGGAFADENFTMCGPAFDPRNINILMYQRIIGGYIFFNFLQKIIHR